jgi:hypothetical protein
MWSRWQRLDWPQRFLLLEAAFRLVGAQLAIRLLPFRRIAPSLGKLDKEPAEQMTGPEEQERARQVGWAVTRLARYAPWDAKCLAQAIAGKRMLNRRRLPSVLFLGVDHGQENWLDAHAWLRCGNEFVTGEQEHERFTVLGAFSEDPR